MAKQFLCCMAIMVITVSHTFAQNPDNYFYPGTAEIEPKDICHFGRVTSFESNPDALKAVRKVLKRTGENVNFVVVPCNKVKTCVAVNGKDGVRYLVYNEKFMKSIEQGDGKSWTAIAQLAHEMAFHFSLDTTVVPSFAGRRQRNIEADEFTGFLLARSGASLEEALATLNNYNNPSCENEINSEYPCRQKREAAIKRGFAGATPSQKLLLANMKGYYEKGEVKEFGGDVYDKNFCFYSCAFEKIDLGINFADRKSAFTSTYSEEGLYGCTLSTTPSQPFIGESNYFMYDSIAGRVTIYYKIKTGPNFGFKVVFEGYLKDNSKLEGILKIERPTLGSLHCFTLAMPVSLQKNN
jgi:hypothetical protein